MISDKSQLRVEFLAKRGAIAPSTIAELSKKIVDELISSNEFQSAKIISCYHPFRNEVDLLSLFSFSNKKAIAFPRVVKGTEKLDFYLIKKLDEFEKGVFGLMEPKPSLPKIEIEKIDLFLIPGVAFTKSGERLGYGGGYYDETLRFKNPNVVTFGICFDIQLAKNIPSQSWDIKMDFIVTESGIKKAIKSTH